VTGEDAVASLHHPGCRPPTQVEVASPDGFTPLPHQSWRARLLKLPAHERDDIVFLVNPSYEVARLLRRRGRWQVATLDLYAALGLGQDLLDGVVPLPSLSAVVDEDRLSVHVSRDGILLERWDLGGSSFPPDVAGILATKDWLTIAVTTSLDVDEPVRHNPLRMLVNARQARLGAGRVRYTDAAQRPRTSDFADEEQRTKLVAYAMAVIVMGTEVEVGSEVVRAAVATCLGDNEPITGLPPEDRTRAAALVALPYMARGYGGIHLMAADRGGAAAYHELFSALCAVTRYTAALLTEEPASERILTQYQADVVIGTPEQFRATHELHRNDTGDWGPDETRGHLALLAGADVRQRAGDVIGRYPRVAVV
jgi:hypothetical protein